MSKPAATYGPRPRSRTLLRAIIAIDFVMMVLLVTNLVLLLFDLAFGGSTLLQQFLREHATGFFELYNTGVHQNFALIDMGFVAVFLVELLVRWAIAAKNRTYHRWFFYPLVHWYDVLGCIPVGSMRFLRALRLIAIIYRLHRLGRIDVRKFYLYRVLIKYKDIVVEEVSDRVVVHVLTGIQDELSHRSAVVDRIWHEVVAPHKDEIAQRLKVGAEHLLRQNIERQRPAIKTYSDRVLSAALDQSRHVFVAFEAIPMLGKSIVKQIETAIKVIVENVIGQLLRDAEDLNVKAVASEVERIVASALTDRDARIEDIVRQIVHQSIEIVKEQVRVQQWKLREAAERAEAVQPSGA